jgi:2,3-diketo-5-methylthio-1-phosphopentane phosphatase
MSHQLKFFCDFDGTITKNDVWVNSLAKFIQNKEAFVLVCDDFASNIISARECINKELKLVENFSFDKFNSYLDSEELDDYFFEFMNYCNNKNYDIFLLSEGLDYYIDYLLNKYGIKLKRFCNKMKTEVINGEIILQAEFPFADENCTYCGMSKRNVLINNTNDLYGEISVFIGDGVSDFCASNYADIVFAKGKLASYCWKNNITYFEYKNFNDILNKIRKLDEMKRIKVRQNASMLRRDVFLGG